MQSCRQCISLVPELRAAVNKLVMKSFGLFLAIAALVACGEARVAGTEEARTTTLWDDLLNHARTNIQSLDKQIRQNLNLGDEQSVIETFTNQSQALATNVQKYITDMSEEVKSKSPELQNLWDNFKGKLTEIKDNFAAQMPEASAQVSQIQTKFDEGVRMLLTESDKIAKTFTQNSGQIKNDISDFTKKVVDVAVTATQKVNEGLQQQATSNKA